MTEDEMEEQFRSEFSETEYSEGNTAKDISVHMEMQYNDVYKHVYKLVDQTRQSLSEKKNILQ